MNDDDFNDFEPINHDFSSLIESKEKVKYSDIRRRLEELFEKKQLKNELDDYLEYD